jgi:chorismate mutase
MSLKFDLTIIAQRLEALEETIIFRFLDRVQYKQNSAVYSTNKILFPILGKNTSLLDCMHKSIERIYAGLGRFTIAEEKPFFENEILSEKQNVVKKREFFDENIIEKINLTAKIKKHYMDFVNVFCENGDDGEYGSTAEMDIAVLVEVSKRIHYGSFYVAESKFLSNPQNYIDAVKKNDENAVKEMLTRCEIEKKIVSRTKEKCEKIQSAYTSKFRKTIDAKFIGNFYENTIIPLTKIGETEYLFKRCENEN